MNDNCRYSRPDLVTAWKLGQKCARYVRAFRSGFTSERPKLAAVKEFANAEDRSEIDEQRRRELNKAREQRLASRLK